MTITRTRAIANYILTKISPFLPTEIHENMILRRTLKKYFYRSVTL